jgi:hypothetical protein
MADPLHERGLGDLVGDDLSDGPAQLGQQPVEEGGLPDGAAIVAMPTKGSDEGRLARIEDAP